MKSPELVATVSSHFPYTLPGGNRSYLSLSWEGVNLTHIYLIPSVDCLQKQQ